MTIVTTPDRTSLFILAVKHLPGVVALLAAVGVVLLIITGHPDQIAAVAVLGAAGGTLQVTVHVSRR
jgi:hypothetical protein